MRFLVDAQLPPALARLLNEAGHMAEHVNDVGFGEASDRVLWRYALEHEAVIVTKDEDFSTMVATETVTPTGRLDSSRQHTASRALRMV